MIVITQNLFDSTKSLCVSTPRSTFTINSLINETLEQIELQILCRNFSQQSQPTNRTRKTFLVNSIFSLDLVLNSNTFNRVFFSQTISVVKIFFIMKTFLTMKNLFHNKNFSHNEKTFFYKLVHEPFHKTCDTMKTFFM